MNDHISGEDLAAYVDGVLADGKKAQLESHFSRCPECQEALAEIVDIQSSRVKIPPEFLRAALGEKHAARKPLLPMRLIFEIAAAFLVVVLIGYFFLSGNRFWQTPEQQKPPVVMDKNVRVPEISVGDKEIAPLPAQRRDLAAAKKTKGERAKADADQALSDSFAYEKRKNVVAGKGLPAAKSEPVQTRARENKLQEIAEEQSRPTTEKESLQKKELVRTATVPEAVGAVQVDLAVKDQTAAKVRKETAAEAPPPRVRVEGDVGLSDLRNPEQFFAWTWFTKGMLLELLIDGAGTVTAVVPLGEFSPLLAEQADREAKKLIFAASQKKSRRARLRARETPPN
jgi:hypothetical protein